MKSLLFCLAVTLAPAFAADKIEHAHVEAQIIEQFPATDVAPGMIQGIAGVGATIPGVPCTAGCFCTINRTTVIPSPKQVYVPGEQVTYFYTIQTTTAAGTADLAVDLKQSGATIQTFTGQVGLTSNSSGVIYFTGQVPSVTGYVTVTFTTTLNGATVQGTAVMLVH